MFTPVDVALYISYSSKSVSVLSNQLIKTDVPVPDVCVSSVGAFGAVESVGIVAPKIVK